MAADLIDRLPEDSDIRRAEAETIARNVSGIAYIGQSVFSMLELKL